MGASLGAYHAANTLFKHPDAVRACFAMSGLYDLRRFMDGQSDDNFYFNNPIDYIGGMTDPGLIAQISSANLHIATGNGPWEHPSQSYDLSRALSYKGISHQLDDWGGLGGHDWPYWKNMMREYLRGAGDTKGAGCERCGVRKVRGATVGERQVPGCITNHPKPVACSPKPVGSR
jgi:esterase/lipase superfamily enzyme